MKKLLTRVAVAIGAAALAIQVIPYGRQHANPRVRQEPSWDRPETRALAQRSCFACHSNETNWPWYSAIAPLSWWIQRDVDRGRRNLNFSEWDRPQEGAPEAIEAVQEGQMPPPAYVLVHSEARLNASCRAALLGGLKATIGLATSRDEAEEDSPGRGER